MGKAPGKKVGPIYVEVDGVRVKFDLRLEVASGRFYVEHEGKVYQGDTKAEIAATMEGVARLARKVEWTRYIVVDYESTKSGDDGYGTGRKSLDERAPNVVKGISIDWEILEFSTPHIPIGEDEEVILERKPGDADVDHIHRPRGRGRHRVRPELPDFAVPFTPERLAVLEQMRTALTVVDRRIRAFLGRDAAQVAHALDQGFAAVGLPQLALPPPEPHAPKCASLNRSCDCGAATDTDDEGNEIEVAEDEQQHDRWCRTKRRHSCDCGKGDDDDTDDE